MSLPESIGAHATSAIVRLGYVDSFVALAQAAAVSPADTVSVRGAGATALFLCLACTAGAEVGGMGLIGKEIQ